MSGFKVATELAVVALGGAIGSVLRHCASLALAAIAPGAPFPWNILAVNAVGCLAIGVLGEAFLRWPESPLWLRPFLIAGVLGGLTTFSAFGHDTMRFIDVGDYARAGANILANLTLGLAAVAVGIWLVRLWPG